MLAASRTVEVEGKPSERIGPAICIKDAACLVEEILSPLRLDVDDARVLLFSAALALPGNQRRPLLGGLFGVVAYKTVPSMEVRVE